ncbi:hypothetical protein HDU67_007900 [Dinochytrium kinnereticum]|nr:hypothetical protein HDU67_007900 [Dinochytrium kinnereticum]
MTASLRERIDDGDEGARLLLKDESSVAMGCERVEAQEPDTERTLTPWRRSSSSSDLFRAFTLSLQDTRSSKPLLSPVLAETQREFPFKHQHTNALLPSLNPGGYQEATWTASVTSVKPTASKSDPPVLADAATTGGNRRRTVSSPISTLEMNPRAAAKVGEDLLGPRLPSCSRDNGGKEFICAKMPSREGAAASASALAGGLWREEMSPIFQFEDETGEMVRMRESAGGVQRLAGSFETDTSRTARTQHRIGRASPPVSSPPKQLQASDGSPTHSNSSQLWGGKSVSPALNDSIGIHDTPSTAFTSGYSSSGGLATAFKADLSTVSPLSFTSSASTFHIPEGEHDAEGVIEMEITRLLSSPQQLPRSSKQRGNAEQPDSSTSKGAATSPDRPAASFSHDQIHRYEKNRSAPEPFTLSATAAEYLPPPAPVTKMRGSCEARGDLEALGRRASFQHVQIASTISPRLSPVQSSGSDHLGYLNNATSVPSPRLNAAYSSSSTIPAPSETRQSPMGMMFRSKPMFESLSPLTIPTSESMRNIWGAPDLTLAPSAFPVGIGSTSFPVSGNGGAVGRVPSTPSMNVNGGYRLTRTGHSASMGAIHGNLHNGLGSTHHSELEATFPSKLLFSGMDNGEGKRGPMREFKDSFASMSVDPGLGMLGGGHYMGGMELGNHRSGNHRQMSTDGMYFQARLPPMLPPPVLPPPSNSNHHRYILYDDFSEPPTASVLDGPALYRNLSGGDLATVFSSSSSTSSTTARYNSSTQASPLGVFTPKGMGQPYPSFSPQQLPMHSPSYSGNFPTGPDQDLPIVREIQTSKLRVDESRLTRDYFGCLTREALEIIAEVTPGVEEIRMREGVFGVVQEIVGRSQKISPAQCVEKIGHALKHAGMKDVKMLTRARVPIVKMRDPVTGIRCDIGFQNNLAIFNTRLLKTYAKIDQRFRELVFIVKYWSKRRNINEPYFGTLSSYCYVLMIIHLLQIRGVLPCLQRICPDGTLAIPAPVHPTLTPSPPGTPNVPPIIEVDGHDVYFYDNLTELPKHWQSKNTESLGELVVAFFKYYSAEFPYVHGVASVRAGRVISKEEKGWTKERQQELNRSGGVKDRFWLCVEDPFEISHNIGRPVDKETLYEVRGEFIRASKFLCAGSSGEFVLSKICEKVAVQPKKSGNNGGHSSGVGTGNVPTNHLNGGVGNGNLFVGIEAVMMGRKF